MTSVLRSKEVLDEGLSLLVSLKKSFSFVFCTYVYVYVHTKITIYVIKLRVLYIVVTYQVENMTVVRLFLRQLDLSVFTIPTNPS